MLSKLIGFAAFAYLARVLEPEAYGSLELAVALSVCFAMVIDFGLSPIGAREVARHPSETRRLAAQIHVRLPSMPIEFTSNKIIFNDIELSHYFITLIFS